MGKGRNKGRVLIALAAMLLMLQGCGGGGSDESANAHINPKSGSTNEVILDERMGTPPAPGKKIELAKVAKAAGCYLLRHVRPENDKEIAANAPAPEYSFDP